MSDHIRLYEGNHEAYTGEAMDIAWKIHKVIEPFILDAIERNISLRDLAQVASSEVHFACLEALLRRNFGIEEAKRK